VKKDKIKLNIFLKSVFRQKIKTLIFFVLIAASAFAFVMRTTEFIVIRDRIDSIAENFRSIGFLQLRDAPYGDILEGAEIIANSPYVGFEDRRRGAEAILHDMHNTNTAGRVGGGGHILTGMEVSHIPTPERDVFSYLYITLEQVVVRNHHLTGHFIELRMTIDEVVAGYLEHAYAAEIQNFITGPRIRLYLELDATENPLAGMEIGERYFVRAALYWVSTHGRGMSTSPPTSPGSAHLLYLHPLTEDGLLYIHAPDGPIDFTTPEMAEIAESIERSHHNASVVWLRTTADMTAMPLVTEDKGSITLAQGRFLTHDDYLEARPVAVVHQQFARMRGLNVGDTITVSVPEQQEIVNPNPLMLFGAAATGGRSNENFVFGEGFLDFTILGQPGEYMIQEMELEIVGIYRKLQDGIVMASWNMGHVSVLLSNYIYIPDSLLPPGFMPVDAIHGLDNYLWDIWYSFELADTRHESAFLLETRQAFDELGIIAHLLPSGAENFWISAEPVLLSTTVNAIMFIAVMILLFALVSFLYLGQRRRDFAIIRALGLPKKTAVKQMCLPAAIFAIPAIIIGGILGWTIALREAEATIGILTEFVYYENYETALATIEISNLWLVLLIGVMTIFMLSMIFFGAVRTSKHSVLELLQGRNAKDSSATKAIESVKAGEKSHEKTGVQCDTTQRAGHTASQSFVAVENQTTKASLTSKTTQTTALNRFRASVQFVIKHIIRAPLKSALTIATAIVFIVALGFLQQTITNTQREVDRLYDTTIVQGEIVPANPFLHGGSSDIVLLQSTYENLVDSNLFKSYYTEAFFSDFFIIHPDENGNFPTGADGAFWDEFWYHIRHELLGVTSALTNPIFATNDLETFLYNYNIADDALSGAAVAGVVDLDGAGLGIITDSMEIVFGDGFSSYDFVYSDLTMTQPVPVILSELTLERRNLEVGDMAFLGHYFPQLWGVSEQIEVPVRVIGKHNGAFSFPDAVIMPMDAFRTIRGGQMNYITFNFEVNPAFNTDTQFVADELTSILRGGRQGTFMSLGSVLRDEQLRVVAGQMEQNLALMLLLYPVIIVVSVAVGAGLALLLLMQSAKIAAILRVLGYGRRRTRAMLSIEQVIVVITGVLVAFTAMPIIGISFTNQLPVLAGLYVIGATLGAVSGAIIITRRAPLELLQVRE